jgi:EAL domain-containing protein (putative c-di-GMP-specific phosphodiesterase class I)
MAPPRAPRMRDPRGLSMVGVGNITLEWALQAQILDFWFQPKVELARNQICGLEMFARMLHPVHGVVPARSLLAGASSESLRSLADLGIKAARSASDQLSSVGAPLPITINAPAKMTDGLMLVRDLLSRRQPDEREREFILDIPEASILQDAQTIHEVATLLSGLRISLAVDDFGQQLCTLLRSPGWEQDQVKLATDNLEKLRGIKLAEVKLDRDLINQCWIDEPRATLCKLVIDLIKALGSKPVATGLECLAEAKKLAELGCLIGQGRHFGEPMPLPDVLKLVRGAGIAAAPPQAIRKKYRQRSVRSLATDIFSLRIF